MLNHNKEIRKLYEDIQKKIYYMIPEKWDKVLLYTSITDLIDGKNIGELFFYYYPKGIFKKKPINVYEIPKKFNLDENDYIKLVKGLYNKILELRNEFKNIEKGTTWTNLTIKVEGIKFHVEYSYEELNQFKFSDKERHVIWCYKYLGMDKEQFNKKDRAVIDKYFKLNENVRIEKYDEIFHIKDIKNIVDYDTEIYDLCRKIEYV